MVADCLRPGGCFKKTPTLTLTLKQTLTLTPTGAVSVFVCLKGAGVSTRLGGALAVPPPA